MPTPGQAQRKGTLGGSNRLLSARDVAAILAVPERTVRDKWREWQLPAYKIGKHLRWRERDVYAWIDRQAAEQQNENDPAGLPGGVILVRLAFSFDEAPDPA
jgi:excisionase family DNA binding protein